MVGAGEFGAWMSAALVFIAVALGTVALALLLEGWAEWRRRRDVVDQLRSFSTPGGGAASETLIRSAKAAEARWFQPIVTRVPQLGDIGQMMDQAGLRWSAPTFLLITLGLSGGLGLAALVILRVWVAGVLAAVAGAWLPYLYVRRKRGKFLGSFEEQLPEACDLLGRAIRSGHPLSSGIKMAADEAEEPVASQFRQVFEEQRFGIPFEDALMGLADRMPLVDVRILVTAILVQREVGGNLAEVLDKIANTIRARFTIRRQLRVYTAQGRFSGYVLALLPIAVGSAIFLINREYMMILFQEPVGRLVMVTGITMQIIGFLWIRQIVNIEI
jgi:tight adherence protein B